jgi:hypothetical protein
MVDDPLLIEPLTKLTEAINRRMASDDTTFPFDMITLDDGDIATAITGVVNATATSVWITTDVDDERPVPSVDDTVNVNAYTVNDNRYDDGTVRIEDVNDREEPNEHGVVVDGITHDH